MPHTFISCILGQWGGVQHKWYQDSKSCFIYLAVAACKIYCPALVNRSRAGQGTLVSISRNIIHGTKAAALVTKFYSNQDTGLVSLLLTVRQISSNVQSLPWTSPSASVKFVSHIIVSSHEVFIIELSTLYFSLNQPLFRLSQKFEISVCLCFCSPACRQRSHTVYFGHIIECVKNIMLLPATLHSKTVWNWDVWSLTVFLKLNEALQDLSHI